MTVAAKVLDFAEGYRLSKKILPNTKKPERINLTLRLERDLHSRAKSLIVRTGAKNMQEVVRQSLALYEALVSEAEAGKDIFVSDPSDKEDRYSLFERQ